MKISLVEIHLKQNKIMLDTNILLYVTTHSEINGIKYFRNIQIHANKNIEIREIGKRNSKLYYIYYIYHNVVLIFL